MNETKAVKRSQRDAATTAEHLAVAFHERWDGGQRQAAMADLVTQLNAVRTSVDAETWTTIANTTRGLVGHITADDPLTRRCVDKPRGYAGDAVTLDIIYGHPRARAYVDGASGAGRSVFSYTANRPATIAVRTRRQVLADAIDATAERVDGARILSLACGHLREAELSMALRQNRVGALYAADQDAESLAELTAAYAGMTVNPLLLSVRDLLKGQRPVADLDLAYSAGLYDYLEAGVAARTTAAMFDMLRPGGRVLVANFHPDLQDIGYMESCMDWWLIYRDEEAMRALFDDIAPEQIADMRLWTDTFGGVVYAEVTRA